MQSKTWSLIGIPDHEAVLNVGGRVGAAAGPQAFQKIFSLMKGRDGVHEALAFQAEPQGLGQDIARNHQLAAELVHLAHQKSPVSVVVGGSHDHGFSHLKGLSESGKRLGCINIDAHLDVRKAEPLITSGSPFYLALESGCIQPKNFIEFGIQRHCNSKDLWEYVEKKGVNVVPFELLRHGRAPEVFRSKLDALGASCDRVAISFDLDAAAQAYAPGVSAPQSEGLTSAEMIEISEIAGAHSKVASIGIFELNPEHDVDHRTARLAATLAYHFVAAALRRS